MKQAKAKPIYEYQRDKKTKKFYRYTIGPAGDLVGKREVSEKQVPPRIRSELK